MKTSGKRLDGGCGEAIEDRVAIIKSRDDQGLYQRAETIFIQTFLDLSYALFTIRLSGRLLYSLLRFYTGSVIIKCTLSMVIRSTYVSLQNQTSDDQNRLAQLIASVLCALERKRQAGRRTEERTEGLATGFIICWFCGWTTGAQLLTDGVFLAHQSPIIDVSISYLLHMSSSLRTR